MPDDERAAELALETDLREQLCVAVEKAKAAKNLRHLHAWIRDACVLCVRLAALGVTEDVAERLDLARLPTFGGTVPRLYVRDGIWSWDPSSVLVGNCVEEVRIVPRVV